MGFQCNFVFFNHLLDILQMLFLHFVTGIFQNLQIDFWSEDCSEYKFIGMPDLQKCRIIIPEHKNSD